MAAKTTVAPSIFINNAENNTSAPLPTFLSNREWVDLLKGEVKSLKGLTGIKRLKAIAWNRHIGLTVSDTQKNVYQRFVGLDAACQGMKLHLLMTRDPIGLKNDGTSNNVKVDIYGLLQTTNQKRAKEQDISIPVFDRDGYKEVVQPFWYNSVKEPKDRLGSRGFDLFKEVYAELFPGAAAFKENMLYAWRNTPRYFWELPDGSQVIIPVEGALEVYNVSISGRIEPAFYTPNQGIDLVKSFSMEYGLVFNKGTRSLCANWTHSLDGWIRREMEMRCRLTKAHALYVLFNSLTSDKTIEDYPLYQRMYDLYKEQGITSSRWFYLLEKNPVIIPDDLKEYLLNMIADRLPSKAFDIFCVHDEYNTTINHLNSLRVQYNEILSHIYASTLLKYVNRIFKTNIQQGKFDVNTFNAIRAHNHLVKL